MQGSQQYTSRFSQIKIQSDGFPVEKVAQIVQPQPSISTTATAWPRATTQPHAPPAVTNLSNQSEEDGIIEDNSFDSDEEFIKK